MDISGLRTPGSIKAWLPVVKDEVRVLCAHVDQTEWEGLRAEATETTLDTATGKSTEVFDPVKFRHLVGRRVVLGIDGITDGEDAQGKAIPLAFTPENIDLLMDKWGAFRITVMSGPMDITRMLAAQREEQKKNS